MLFSALAQLFPEATLSIRGRNDSWRVEIAVGQPSEPPAPAEIDPAVVASVHSISERLADVGR